jgi:hypothetical protein
LRTAAALPYLLPSDDAVTVEAWRTADGAELSERLPHWEPFTNVQLVRGVGIDADAIRAECQLPADAALALVATWRSDRTRLSGAGPTVELGALDGELSCHVELDVPGPSAGGTLSVLTRLVLRTTGNEAAPIAPARPAAVLWEDLIKVVLEGGSARFPVSACDFGTVQWLPSDGEWALDWDIDDLEAPTVSALRLLVNEANEELVGAVKTGSSDSRSLLVREFIRYDVARSLVHGALSSEAFLEAPDSFEEGTLGRTLRSLLDLHWNGVPVDALRARPAAQLDAELVARLGVMK